MALLKKCTGGLIKKQTGGPFLQECCAAWVIYMEVLLGCVAGSGTLAGHICTAWSKAFMMAKVAHAEGSTVLLYALPLTAYGGACDSVAFSPQFAPVALNVTPPLDPSPMVAEYRTGDNKIEIQIYARVREAAELDLIIPNQSHTVRLTGPQPPTNCADFLATYTSLTAPGLYVSNTASNGNVALGPSRCINSPPSGGCYSDA